MYTKTLSLNLEPVQKLASITNVNFSLEKYVKYPNHCYSLNIFVFWGLGGIFIFRYTSVKSYRSFFLFLTLPADTSAQPHTVFMWHLKMVCFYVFVFNKRTSSLQKHLHKNYFLVQRRELTGKRVRSICEEEKQILDGK